MRPIQAEPDSEAGASDRLAIEQVLQAYPELQLAILFGSLAKDQARASSDVDLAVDLGRPMSSETKLGLIGDLAEATGRPIDLIDLREVGYVLLGQILRQGIRLVGDTSQLAELTMRYLNEEADFGPILRSIQDERRRRWIGS